MMNRACDGGCPYKGGVPKTREHKTRQTRNILPWPLTGCSLHEPVHPLWSSTILTCLVGLRRSLVRVSFMTNSNRETIAIIGGGFSGVMKCVNLARLSRHPLQVTLINQHRPKGRGVAFGSRRMEHLLNVAARNMSAFPDMPNHFVQWLRTRSEYDTVPDSELRERFIPRMIYGDY